jgi:hypothetical protein
VTLNNDDRVLGLKQNFQVVIVHAAFIRLGLILFKLADP